MKLSDQAKHTGIVASDDAFSEAERLWSLAPFTYLSLKIASRISSDVQCMAESLHLSVLPDSRRMDVYHVVPGVRNEGEHKVQAVALFAFALYVHRLSAETSAKLGLFLPEKAHADSAALVRVLSDATSSWPQADSAISLDEPIQIFLEQAGFSIHHTDAPLKLDARQIHEIYEEERAKITKSDRSTPHRSA